MHPGRHDAVSTKIMTEIDILLRMCGALVAGALIGLERTYRGRAAGLRTYALVALGSALLVAASEYAVSWAARRERAIRPG